MNTDTAPPEARRAFIHLNGTWYSSLELRDDEDEIHDEITLEVLAEDGRRNGWMVLTWEKAPSLPSTSGKPKISVSDLGLVLCFHDVMSFVRQRMSDSALKPEDLVDFLLERGVHDATDRLDVSAGYLSSGEATC